MTARKTALLAVLALTVSLTVAPAAHPTTLSAKATITVR
ncbi:hypothetical protein SAMN05421811_12194 [Nonomuraea wenchangensis]|uniref:Uncharacterized protein n=1 Tax=Nonomuraea wenchangensis TaxID=568860 RepID=A0A1I0LP25_9ACTN|nr:hypothetical protein SAMN05421811_12194 [Nonomuraea wenchangensis]